MADHRDPFELLQDLNPVDERELADAAASVEAQRALARIVAEPRQRSRRLRLRLPRRRVYVLVAVPLAAALAATAWALTRSPTRELTVGCYAAAQLDARVVVVAATDEPATRACSAVWSRGEFVTVEPPPLQACVLPSGGIGVFPSPGGTACRDLSLVPLAEPPARTGTTTPRGSPRELKDSLVKDFLSRPCIDKRQATDIVRNELRQLGLADWSMQTNGAFSSSRPCASLAFDEERRLVLLTPMPKRP